MTDEIRFDRKGAWGVVTLDRPKALNALTKAMAAKMLSQLNAWALDEGVGAVLVKGAGDKAFCAGGDIRWLHDAAKKDPVAAAEFFRVEYQMNAAIKHFPKPYVALIDGVTMGGGVGLSVHGDFRIAGDRTLFAMPENGIGLFPDVGGGYFMPRLKDGLGWWYALTGARAKAADCVEAGVATHYVPTEAMDRLETALTALAAPAADAVASTLSKFADVPGGDGRLSETRPHIERLFQGRESLEALYDALASDKASFAAEALETCRRMSPTSMAITWEQFVRGAEMDFNEVMRMEFRIASRIMEGGDFFEGVRAQIIDKDRSPNWGEARPVGPYFAPFEDEARELSLPG